MVVWNVDKTVLVNLSNKDIKIVPMKLGFGVVACDCTGQYILHVGDGWDKYFAGVSVHLRPVDPLETIKE